MRTQNTSIAHGEAFAVMAYSDHIAKLVYDACSLANLSVRRRRVLLLESVGGPYTA